MYLKINRNDFYLILIFIILTLSLLLKIFFDENGYLSNDSTNYLSASKSFLNGHYFFTFYEFGNNLELKFFSNWPVGYSLLISIVSFLTNTSVFFASKIVNFICIFFIIFIFRSYFNQSSLILSSIFFFSANLEIFSFSWSEGPFILFLILFSLYLHKFLFINDNYKTLLILSILSISLFLIRYIGLFTLFIYIFFFIYSYLFKIKVSKSKLVILFFINFFFITLYFYNNYLLTSYIAGIPRGFAPETNLELLKKLILTLLSEITIPTYHERITFLIPLLSIQILLIIFYFRENIFNFSNYQKINIYDLIQSLFLKNIFQKNYNIIGFVGISYILSIIFVRWIFYFNEYSFRLLGPGTFLIFIWLIIFLKEKLSISNYKNFSNIFFILLIISFILYVPIKTYLRFEKTYFETINETLNYYNEISDLNIIVNEKSKHIKYLRPNLQFKKPFLNENYNSFLERINNNNPTIYIDISFTDKDINFYEKYFKLQKINKEIYKVIKIK